MNVKDLFGPPIQRSEKTSIFNFILVRILVPVRPLFFDFGDLALKKISCIGDLEIQKIKG